MAVETSRAAARPAADPVAEVCALRADVGYLQAIDLFRDVTLRQMEEIDRSLIAQEVPKGKVLYTPGETGEVLYLVRRGAVLVYRMSPEGRKLVLGRLGPNSFFGEMSCIAQGMYDAFAEAAEDSIVFTMSCADVGRLLATNPQVSLRLLEAMGRRVIEAEQQLEEVAFKGLVPRVAALLLKASDGGEVRGLSHQDLADRLGVYRETVTGALKALKTVGAIDVGRKRIRILDRGALERSAAAGA
jgi:CRP/FNR family cyclic AMP-dependent transcriptional regulator